MAARGSVAKNFVEKKIAEAFAGNVVGVFDKKLYVWADDGGERVQIAITLTCPKNMIDTINYKAESSEVMNFEDMSAGPIASTNAKIEITEEEKQNIAELMRRLGL